MFRRAGRIGLIGVLLAFHGLAREPAAVAGLSAEDERIIAALPVIPAGLNQAHGLEVKRSKAILASYTFKVQTPDLTATEWLVIFPQPVTLPSQKILAAAGRPKCETTADLSPLRQPLLQARIPVENPRDADQVTLTVKVRAELFSRRLTSRHGLGPVPNPARLAEPERKLFLRRTRDFDYDRPSFQTWVTAKGLRRQAAEGEVVFARRVFQTLAGSFGYEYLGMQDRTASHVCAVGKSDCGGLSVLFATVLRSQGVPARTLAGRWAISAKAGDKVGTIEYFQEHVKAEFFATGVGWVPADLSAAVVHDKSPEKLTYFGNDKGDFLTLHFDSDLSCDTGHFGVRGMNLSQRASYWASGTGTVRDAVITEQWEVEVLPGTSYR
jgi:transglutaminase-like putative cysteine protease